MIYPDQHHDRSRHHPETTAAIADKGQCQPLGRQNADTGAHVHHSLETDPDPYA